jgi:hypothetical protein
VKLFYISTHAHNRRLRQEWHAIDLGHGKTLTVVRWKDPIHEMKWASHPDVIPLPHPIFQNVEPLTDEQLHHLSRRFNVEKGHNVHHVVKQAARLNPLFRLQVL